MPTKNTFWDKLKFLATGQDVKADSYYKLNSVISTELLGFNDSASAQKSQQFLLDSGYGSNVTAYSIIKKIAQTGASMPLTLYEVNKKGEKKLVNSGELYNILKRPAVMQGESLSMYDYMELALTYLLASGNLYQRGITSVGFGSKWYQMEFLPSGITAPIVPNSYFAQPLGYVVADMNKDYTVKFDEVLHTRFISPTTYGLNNFIGLSPLQAAIYSLTGSTDIQKAIAIMIKNQGVRGVLTNESERSMSPEEQKRAAGMADNKLRGLDNFNKIFVSNTKMNYLQVGMSATDLKVIESGVLTDRQLCNAYAFPSVLLNDPANTSYNNYQQALKALYNIAVIPVVEKILDDLNNIWLNQYATTISTFVLEVNRENIEALQNDQILEAQKDKVVTDSILAVLVAPIGNESKIELLVYAHGLEPEAAKKIVATNAKITV